MALLEDKNIDPEVVLYLENIPTKKELKDILAKLNISAFELIRKGEAVYKEKFKSKNFSEEEWIEIMIANPKLIERPIVIKGKKAVLGRPPENVLSIL